MGSSGLLFATSVNPLMRGSPKAMPQKKKLISVRRFYKKLLSIGNENDFCILLFADRWQLRMRISHQY